jgi:hypothetical protein
MLFDGFGQSVLRFMGFDKCAVHPAVALFCMSVARALALSARMGVRDERPFVLRKPAEPAHFCVQL